MWFISNFLNIVSVLKWNDINLLNQQQIASKNIASFVLLYFKKKSISNM